MVISMTWMHTHLLLKRRSRRERIKIRLSDEKEAAHEEEIATSEQGETQMMAEPSIWLNNPSCK